jgi:hypothetical protein
MKKFLIAICCASLISTTATAQMVTGATEGLNDAGSAGAMTKKGKAKAKMSKAKGSGATKQN